MNFDIAPPLLWALVIFQMKHVLADFVLAARYGLRGDETYFSRGRLVYALLHAVGSFPAILLLAGWRGFLAAAFLAEIVLTYHLAWGHDGLRGRQGASDTVSAAALTGGEQLLHQLFYLAVVAAVLLT
jgi:hypothetical protein